MSRIETVPLTPFVGERNDKKRYCCHPGCRSFAEFPAPRREKEDKTQDGYCLEHARLHNEAWNYFADMSREEIEYHRRQDMVGWRPSWPLGESGASYVRVIDPFDVEAEQSQAPSHDQSVADKRLSDIPTGIRCALNVLGLSPGVTFDSLKKRYKELARRLHPDANGGDRCYEERFRKVHEAYEQLSAFFGHARSSVE